MFYINILTILLFLNLYLYYTTNNNIPDNYENEPAPELRNAMKGARYVALLKAQYVVSHTAGQMAVSVTDSQQEFVKKCTELATALFPQSENVCCFIMCSSVLALFIVFFVLYLWLLLIIVFYKHVFVHINIINIRIYILLLFVFIYMYYYTGTITRSREFTNRK